MFALSQPGRPRLAYGFWRYSEAELELAERVLEQVRAAGVDHLDTADIYGGARTYGGAERLLGALRRRAPALFAGATLATKAGVEFGSPYNSSPAYLTAACDASLTRLGVERIDLFYIHRPDLLTHPAELAKALDALIAQGKVGAIGVSNFLPSQIDALAAHLKAPLAAHQIELSIARPAAIINGMLDQAMQRGIGVLAWSPLAGGRVLAQENHALAEIARRRGAPLAAVALAFLLRHPACVTPIIGTRRPERLRACLRAPHIDLAREEWYAILEGALGQAMP